MRYPHSILFLAAALVSSPSIGWAQQLTLDLPGFSSERAEIRDAAERFSGSPKLGTPTYAVEGPDGAVVATFAPPKIVRSDAKIGGTKRRGSRYRFTAQAAPGYIIETLRVEVDSTHSLTGDDAARGETSVRIQMGDLREDTDRAFEGPTPATAETDVVELPVDAGVTTQTLFVRVSANLQGGSGARIRAKVERLAVIISVRRVAPDLPANWFAYHVIGRASFGMTPTLYDEVIALGTPAEAEAWADRYLKTQLELDPALDWPTGLDTPAPLPSPIPLTETAAFETARANQAAAWQVVSGTPRPTQNNLTDYTLRRMVEGQAQLRELMTYFWDNHFHTAFRASNRGHYEWLENRAFYRDAFSTFRTLLGDSAKSAAMLLYLDQNASRRGAPNENYARELMELHTLGVDAGYTSADISAAAAVLTGWRKNSGSQPGFRFVPSYHEPGDKQFSAIFPSATISFRSGSSGVQEGEELLDMLAAMEGTARFISRKLIVKFVMEAPNDAYVNRIASVFSGSGGDIRKVLIAIFTSPEFRDPANYMTKVKTPIELVTSTFRAFDVQRRYGRMNTFLDGMGMPMFQAAPPTGYSELGIDWLGTNLILNQTKAAFEIVDPGYSSAYTVAGRPTFWLNLTDEGVLDEGSVIEFFGNLILRGTFSEDERDRFLTILRSGGENPFVVSSADDERSLDLLVGAMLVSPTFYYQ